MSTEGYAEQPHDGKVGGWVWNPAEPARALHVEIFNGGTFYQRTLADLFRDDLARAGKRAGYCSFQVTLPPAFEGELHVVLDGTPHRLHTTPSTEAGVMQDWLDGDGLFLRPSLLVHRLTSSVLGRSATRLELLKYATQTGDVHTLSRLARTIMASAPDIATERSEEYLVDQIYLGVLTRTADERGLQVYADELRGGMAMSNIIRQLIRSPEFTRFATPAAAPAPTGDVSVDVREMGRAMKAALATLMLDRITRDGSSKG